MTRERFNFWMDAELREGLRQVAERDGILESEQIRRAIRDWLERKGIALKGVTPKGPSRRVVARRKG